MLSIDDGELGFNVYSYCTNNPIHNSDPSGYGRLTKSEQEKLKKLREQKNTATIYEERLATAIAMDRINGSHYHEANVRKESSFSIGTGVIHNQQVNDCVISMFYLDVGKSSLGAGYLDMGFFRLDYIGSDVFGFTIDVLHGYIGLEPFDKGIVASSELFTVSAYVVLDYDYVMEIKTGIGYGYCFSFLNQPVFYESQLLAGTGFIFDIGFRKR